MRYVEPQFLPWDGRRVPMTFLAGYLGAGKTTLLNELLARTTRPIAVLVNDVGEVNVDARLIKKRSGDTIELSDGCVCCSLNEGFGMALDQLRAMPQAPDHVVVELSGVAEPDRVAPWANSAGFGLDAIVTLVDVDQFSDRMAETIAGHAIARQIEAADVVLLTKTDLADGAQTTAASTKIAELGRPGLPILTTTSITSVAALIELGGRRPGGPTETPPPTLFDRHVTSIVPLPERASIEQLDALIDGLAPGVVRAKGIAVGPDGEPLVIQVVGARRVIEPLPPAEVAEPTDLVVIRYPVA